MACKVNLNPVNFGYLSTDECLKGNNTLKSSYYLKIKNACVVSCPYKVVVLSLYLDDLTQLNYSQSV